MPKICKNKHIYSDGLIKNKNKKTIIHIQMYKARHSKFKRPSQTEPRNHLKHLLNNHMYQ